MAKRIEEEKKNRYNSNYSFRHSYELLRNYRKVLFLDERFLCRNDKENNEYLMVFENEIFGRESVAEHYRDPDNWSLNLTQLDDYVDGKIEIQRVVGDKTKFCGIHIDSNENDCAQKAVKKLYRVLREKFNIPSYGIIVYEDGWCGYYVLIIFFETVNTSRVASFQRCVVNCTADIAMNCGASVRPVVKKREYIPMPFGVNPKTKAVRHLVNVSTLTPVSNLRSYALSHIALSKDEVNALLALKFDDVEKQIIKPSEWEKGELLDISEYPSCITISGAELKYIRGQKKKGVRMILLIMMICLKTAKEHRTVSGITISMNELTRLSNLSISTVKTTVNEMCSCGILAKVDASPNDIIVNSRNMGPDAATYSLGDNAISAIGELNTLMLVDCHTLPTTAVLKALYAQDDYFFPACYERLMAVERRL